MGKPPSCMRVAEVADEAPTRPKAILLLLLESELLRKSMLAGVAGMKALQARGPDTTRRARIRLRIFLLALSTSYSLEVRTGLWTVDFIWWILRFDTGPQFVTARRR